MRPHVYIVQTYSSEGEPCPDKNRNAIRSLDFDFDCCEIADQRSAICNTEVCISEMPYWTAMGETGGFFIRTEGRKTYFLLNTK